MKLYRILLVMLVLGSRQGTAQTNAAASEWAPRRWTVSTQLAAYPRVALVEAVDGQGGTDRVRPWPVMLTVAYRTEHKASLQVGLLMRADPAHTISASNSSGTYTNRKRAVTWIVPIVTQIHLLLPQPKRWKIDFEIGLMPLSSQYNEETMLTDVRTGQTSTTGATRYSYSDIRFLGGLGVAYALTPKLSLTADARATFSFLAAAVSAALSKNGIRNDISAFAPALSTGVSYQFGKTL